MKNFSLDSAAGIDVRATSMARSPSAMLSDDAEERCRTVRTDQELLGLLTPREVEAVRACALGESMKETAKRLGLSNKTIQTHRMVAMGKLGLHNAALLTRFAVRIGLIQP